MIALSLSGCAEEPKPSPHQWPYEAVLVDHTYGVAF